MPRAPRARRPKSASVFGTDVVDKNLIFPIEGNITAAEILAFCPYWLKSADIVFRFCANGMKQMIAAEMINHFRILPGTSTTANSIYKMISNTMRDMERGHKWTVNEHDRLVPEGWPAHRLDCRGFRTDYDEFPERQRNRAGPYQVSFDDMMRGVRNLPEGDDALDLTRCVKYAASHPEETWIFPRDFSKLVHKLGGPKQVAQPNWDEEIFARWAKQAGYTWTPVASKKSMRDEGSKQGENDKALDCDVKMQDAGLFAADGHLQTRYQFQGSGVTLTHIPGLTPPPSFIVKLDTSRLPHHLLPPNDPNDDSDVSSVVQGKDNFAVEASNMQQASNEQNTDNNQEASSTQQTSSMQQADHKDNKDKKDRRKKDKEKSTQHAYLQSPKTLSRVRPRHLLPVAPKRKLDYLNMVNTDRYNLSFEMPTVHDWPNYTSDPGLLQPCVEESQVEAAQPSRESSPEHGLRRQAFDRTFQNYPGAILGTIGEQLYHINPPNEDDHRTPSRTLMSTFHSPTNTAPTNLMLSTGRDPQLVTMSPDGVVDDTNSANVHRMISHVYSPYAFNGPRASSPFRALHHLTSLRDDDVSEWAETIRWVKEQHNGHGETRWNERPTHITAIEKMRKDTGWTSEVKQGVNVHSSGK